MDTPLAQVSQPGSNPPQRVRRSVPDARFLGELLQGLSAKAPRVKYACARALRQLSETRPDLLYPRFDFFVRLLDHPNKILQWQGALILAGLARADSEGKFARIFDKYFAPLAGPVMITAANVLQGGARIAEAKPQWAGRIAAEMLKVARARYQTRECRNVAIGHAIAALTRIFPLLDRPAPVVHFVRRQLRNSRPATRKKAERFLKRAKRPERRLQSAARAPAGNTLGGTPTSVGSRSAAESKSSI